MSEVATRHRWDGFEGYDVAKGFALVRQDVQKSDFELRNLLIMFFKIKIVANSI
jgi:hypothetical protein